MTTELGLSQVSDQAWRRHPLAFLTEAADDICYHIIDMEDGFGLKRIPLDTVKVHLLPIGQPEDMSYMNSLSERERVSYMCACAIDRLITDVADAFMTHEQEIVSGKLGDDGASLIDLTKWADTLKDIGKLTCSKVYQSELVVPFEIAGAECIAGLLDAFSRIAMDLKRKKFEFDEISLKHRQINDFFEIGLNNIADIPNAITRIVDYVSGMTDRFAISSYRKIKGISF